MHSFDPMAYEINTLAIPRGTAALIETVWRGIASTGERLRRYRRRPPIDEFDIRATGEVCPGAKFVPYLLAIATVYSDGALLWLAYLIHKVVGQLVSGTFYPDNRERLAAVLSDRSGAAISSFLSRTGVTDKKRALLELIAWALRALSFCELEAETRAVS